VRTHALDTREVDFPPDGDFKNVLGPDDVCFRIDGKPHRIRRHTGGYFYGIRRSGDGHIVRISRWGLGVLRQGQTAQKDQSGQYSYSSASHVSVPPSSAGSTGK